MKTSLEIARAFTSIYRENFAYVFVNEGRAMSTDGWRIVSVKTRLPDGIYSKFETNVNMKDVYLKTHKTTDLRKFLATKDGEKVTLEIPKMLILEDPTGGEFDLENMAHAHVQTAVMKSGALIILKSLPIDERKNVLAVINLGFLEPLAGMTVDMYFKGPLDAIYFEAVDNDIHGSLMPQKMNWRTE